MCDDKKEAKTDLVVHDTGPLAHIFDPEKFAQTWRVACSIAASTLLPDHLRLNMKTKQPLEAKQVESNILRIVNQAIRWQVDPYAIVDCTYVVANKLGYEGKLVAGVVNARAGLKARLSYAFSGSGNGRTVTVSGTFKGEDEVRTIELSVGQAKTTNKMWTNDPDQKLVYSGATKWARRFCPEIMLGVLTDHDLEVIRESGPTIQTLSVTADKPSLSTVSKAKAEAKKEPEPPAEDAPETLPMFVEVAADVQDDFDAVDQRLDGYRELYEQAQKIEEIDALDAQAKADAIISSKPNQAVIFGENGYSKKARLRE